MEKDDNSLIGQYRDRMALIGVSLSCRRCQVKLPKTMQDTKVQGHEVDEKRFQAGTIQLIPVEIIEEFNTIARKRNPILASYTLPLNLAADPEEAFADDDSEAADGMAADSKKTTQRASRGGMALRILPRSAVGDVLPPLDEISKEIVSWVVELKTRWDREVVQYNRSYWEPILGSAGYTSYVVSRLPSANELGRCYNMRMGIYDVGPSTIASVGRADAVKSMEKARKNAELQITNAFLSASTAPMEKLVSSIKTLQENMAAGKRLSEGSFTDLTQSMRLIKSFGEFALPANSSLKIDDLWRRVEQIHLENQSRGSRTFKDAIAPLIDDLKTTMDRTLLSVQKALNAKNGEVKRSIRYFKDAA